MNFTTEEYKTIIRTLINENNRLRTELKTTEETLGHFMMKLDTSDNYGKPSSELSKLKLFAEVFDALSGPDKNDVNLDRFISELVSTGRFTEDESKIFLRKAMENGHIYERKLGYYAKV